MVKRIYEQEVTEYRRIIRSGDSFVISVPREWLDQNKIEPRDEIECKISKNKIVITNKKWKKE